MKNVIKMTDKFKGWENYSDEEFEQIIKNATITVDSSTLLDIYRYSNKSSTEIINIFSYLKNRVWISYYVGVEYYRNKNTVEKDTISYYSEKQKSISNSFSDIYKTINEMNANKIFGKERIRLSIEKTEERVNEIINKELESKRAVFNSLIIEKSIIDIFDDKMGAEYSDDEFRIVREEGLRRFKDEIPPGYKDSKKSENGDYHIYSSIIDYAKENQKDMIFITDDRKEDWFFDFLGAKIARPELLNEFYEKTGKLILIFTLEQFLKLYYEKIVDKKIDTDLLAEILSVKNDKDEDRESPFPERTLALIAARLNNEKDNNALLNNRDYIIKNLKKLELILKKYPSIFDNYYCKIWDSYVNGDFDEYRGNIESFRSNLEEIQSTIRNNRYLKHQIDRLRREFAVFISKAASDSIDDEDISFLQEKTTEIIYAFSENEYNSSYHKINLLFKDLHDLALSVESDKSYKISSKLLEISRELELLSNGTEAEKEIISL